MTISSQEEEEGDTLSVGHKTDQPKATKNKSRVEPVAIALTAITQGLKRSYAMLNVLDMNGDNFTDTEFEARNESEQAESTSAGIVELDYDDDDDDDKTPKKAVKSWVRKATSAGIIELDDEDETPKKKKKKVSKPPVREMIKVKRQLGPVCFVDS